MNNDAKDKIAKVYELVKRGVSGERDAAKAALDRLMKKYNLSDKEIERITFKEYRFKYAQNTELMLFTRLFEYLFTDRKMKASRDSWGVREIAIELEYIDWVTLECAYEYFRKHMRGEYRRLVTPKLKRYRKPANKKRAREKLDEIFFSNYVIASKLYKEGELTHIDHTEMSNKERQDRAALRGVKGGEFNTQLTTGLYLEQ
ncbi:hypothetical protein QO206_03260 [Leeuwenhoekiella aequorea]|uniref:hypothetical protein n=1 Tax=Leeuwenhoekiella aequorea TaxID=283736 RepID=UPI00352F0D10|tara:strand:+ start:8627 stop:9232 length:606 start_codon:yes stop_codon:yes gene_type:complete